MKKPFLITLLLCFGTIAHSQTGTELQDRKKKIEAQDHAGCSEEQDQRKTRSIAYCKANTVPAFNTLPCIESETVTKIRTKDEVVKRALALVYLGAKSEGVEKGVLNRIDSIYQIRENFSAQELKYVDNQAPTQQETVNASWRYESLHVMLWALGYVDELKYPSEACDVATDVGFIVPRNLEEFTNDAKLRSKKEILDQADLIYRLHWAVVDARIKSGEPPGNLHPSVAYERHYALNWLMNYMNQDWDDISTDT